MKATRRSWAALGLAAGFAAFAVVLARPLALAGTVLLGAWVLARQYLFFRAATELSEAVTVTQTPAKRSARTGEGTPTTLSVTLDTPSRLSCALAGGLPTAATTSGAMELELDPHQVEASRTVEVSWPVAGRHVFDRARLSVTDGLFRESFPVGSTPGVTVEPRGPRNLHVGEGGDRIASAYGEHAAGRLGSGIEPAGLREYVPGERADRIDWNATARLGTPHVREFEAETDRQTVLVVDQRHTLDEGPPEEAKLDYLRELVLAFTDSARRQDDPLGLLTVGDEGITNRLTPATGPDRYRTVRRLLLNLEPTPAPSAGPTAPATRPTRRRGTKTLAEVRRAVATLGGEESDFGRRLRPFYAARQRYVERIGTDPLYRALERTLATERGSLFTVLCTDDSTPTELLETVKLAHSDGGTVLVLLAPTVLYEEGGLADVERAYDRYLEFEELRRELAGMDRVTALEVGPGDRLSAVLEASRDRGQSPRTRGEPS